MDSRNPFEQDFDRIAKDEQLMASTRKETFDLSRKVNALQFEISDKQRRLSQIKSNLDKSRTAADDLDSKLIFLEAQLNAIRSRKQAVNKLTDQTQSEVKACEEETEELYRQHRRAVDQWLDKLDMPKQLRLIDRLREARSRLRLLSTT